jgi:ERF superfamily
MPDEPNGAVAVADDRQQLADRITRTPYEIISLAVEKGASADTIERLVKLAEHVQALESQRAFNEAMVRAQKKMPKVTKSKENGGTNSMYAPLEEIEVCCKSTWENEGFSLTFHENKADREGFIRSACDIGHAGGHVKQVWIELPPDGKGPKGGDLKMNAVQACISTGSYAQRVMICRIFNIAIVGTDKDGQGDGLSPDQINVIEEALTASGVPRERLLKFLQVEDLDQLSASRFPVAMFKIGEFKEKKKAGAK